MKKFEALLLVEGVEPPSEERDIPVPVFFTDLLESLRLTRFKGTVEISDENDYRRFQEAIRQSITAAKKKIAQQILIKTNARIRPERIKLTLQGVNELK